MKISKIFFVLLSFFALITKISAQQDKPYTCHEWGTFTSLFSSNGQQLDGLYLEEEPLPSFCYNLDRNFLATFSSKGVNKTKLYANFNAYGNAFIKMETPVLYFYSQYEIQKIKVNIDFNKGTISQFYPQRFGGESEYVWQTSTKSIPTEYNLLYNQGSIFWQFNVLNPTTDNNEITYPKAENSKIWLAPRETKSNLLEVYTEDSNLNVKREVEKYLFYRGVGSFGNPIIPKFDTSGQLSIYLNSNLMNVPYYMVFERTPEGKNRVWSEGSLHNNEVQKIKPTKEILSDFQWNNKKNRFITELVKSGLFEDEARAMLKTWDASYFNTPGIKIFWIVPRCFTDIILPITLSPKPQSLERVMVGRTEILDPRIDKAILFDSVDAIKAGLVPAHYEKAIKYRKTRLTKEIGSDKLLNLRDSMNIQLEIEVTPNPCPGYLFITSSDILKSDLNWECFNIKGQIVNSGKISKENESRYCEIDLNQLSEGYYYIKLHSDEVNLTKKLIIAK